MAHIVLASSDRPCPSTSPAAPEGLAAQDCPAWKVGCPLPLDVGRSPVPKSRGASKVAGPGPKPQVRKNVSAAAAAARVNALDYSCAAS